MVGAGCCRHRPLPRVDWLQDGEASRTTSSTNAPRTRTSPSARRLRHHPHSADGALLKEKKWGAMPAGYAPGVKFENCYWCQDKQIAEICTDTLGVEVRPNETTEANQPWHWV